jgi:hypothetical protein
MVLFIKFFFQKVVSAILYLVRGTFFKKTKTVHFSTEISLFSCPRISVADPDPGSVIWDPVLFYPPDPGSDLFLYKGY